MKNDVIMGWDAAWTPKGGGAWAVATGNRVVLLESTPHGEDLLDRLSGLLTEFSPALIAIDLPMAIGGVRGWRAADLATTRAFSRFGCPVHSPTPARPGEWGDRILRRLGAHGVQLTVKPGLDGPVCAEVYPHTALLDLLKRDYRLPYKAAKSAAYWPGITREDRKVRLLATYRDIWKTLSESFDLPPFPRVGSSPRVKDLKQLEDLTDALVCLHAACGIQAGTFHPFGDETAAIWNPPVGKS